MEAWFSLLGDSANLDARYVHGLYVIYHMLGNHLDAPDGNSLIMCVIWNLSLVCFEIVLVSVQDMCMVCA